MSKRLQFELRFVDKLESRLTKDRSMIGWHGRSCKILARDKTFQSELLKFRTLKINNQSEIVNVVAKYIKTY